MISKILRGEYQDAFQKLQQLQKAKLDAKFAEDAAECPVNLPPAVPDEIMNCLICNARKHQCSWLCRENLGSQRKCSGGTCNACHKACGWLKCCRSPALLHESGAIAAVLTASHLKRQKLGDADVCICVSCSGD